MVSRELAVLLGELLLLEAREAREAHLEDGLGLALGEEIVAALADSAISASGRPARRTNASSPESGSFISAILASSGSAAARMVRTTRSTSVTATPSPSTISRCASACRSSKRDASRHDVAAVLDERRQRLA